MIKKCTCGGTRKLSWKGRPEARPHLTCVRCLDSHVLDAGDFVQEKYLPKQGWK